VSSIPWPTAVLLSFFGILLWSLDYARDKDAFKDYALLVGGGLIGFATQAPTARSTTNVRNIENAEISSRDEGMPL